MCIRYIIRTWNLIGSQIGKSTTISIVMIHELFECDGKQLMICIRDAFIWDLKSNTSMQIDRNSPLVILSFFVLFFDYHEFESFLIAKSLHREWECLSLFSTVCVCECDKCHEIFWESNRFWELNGTMKTESSVIRYAWRRVCGWVNNRKEHSSACAHPMWIRITYTFFSLGLNVCLSNDGFFCSATYYDNFRCQCIHFSIVID